MLGTEQRTAVFIYCLLSKCPGEDGTDRDDMRAPRPATGLKHCLLGHRQREREVAVVDETLSFLLHALNAVPLETSHDHFGPI